MKTEIKTQHTPTPWRIAPDEPLIVETMDGSEIADCSMLNASMPKAADAAFIVHTVNNFDDMLNELKSCKRQLESFGLATMDTERVIAKAEEK